MFAVLMSNSPHRILKQIIYSASLCLLAFSLGFFASVTSQAQQKSQLPSQPSGYVTDVAGVVDSRLKERLEVVLKNLKDRTKIEFYIATVDTTGGSDIFAFSRQLANEWNLGSRNSGSRSLLLVVEVASKTSFTQFSRLAQPNLPDGVLGEMAQRMREPLNAGRFSEAVETGVYWFVNALGSKFNFSAQDLEKPATSTLTADATAEVVQKSEASSTSEPQKIRPRVVKENSKPAEKEPVEQPTPTPQTDSSIPPQTVPNDPKPVETAPVTEPTPAETKPPEKEPVPNTKSTAKQPRVAPTAKKVADPVDDEAEADEVELTLTLPLAKRAAKLREFLDKHPDSKARPRATELLISTHAGLGDQFLKSGDAENGIKQLLLAIDESEATISDKLFNGVISQIPSNLYLRGQSDAAFKAAANIETKFGSDLKRLLAVSEFYRGLERGDEVARVAEAAVKLSPDSAEAHRVLAIGRHLNLQVDEAAAEYKRTIELDPTSRVSKISLADLTRAGGKPEEALTLYNELLATDPKDRVASAGAVICLLELGRKDEAMRSIEAALASEPMNLALLSGVAYWFTAHGEYEKGFDYARRAIILESRYTWAQIALVRSLIGMNRYTGAERAMRYAAQFGKFPTLNYELANVLSTMGFYDEAADILRQSFTIKDGEIETYLAGRIPAHDKSFIELLAPERRASIYQPTAADSKANSAMLKNLLALDTALRDTGANEKPDEKKVAQAATDFASGTDNMRPFRQVYAANRLLKSGVALHTARELAESAKQNVESALNVPVATSAVQAEEFRILRVQALGTGNIPEVADAPRSTLSAIMRGRIDDIIGWILFNQDKYPEAIERLKLASSTAPNGTPVWRNSLWHLGAVYELTANNTAALNSYIESYKSGERDPIRRSTIERLYKKVNGSTAGLADKIGAADNEAVDASTSNTGSSQAAEPAPASVSSSAIEKPVETTTTSVETTKPETSKPEATPVATPETTSASTSASTETPAPTQPEPASEEALKAAGSRLHANVKIMGRVLDASGNGMPNVAMVLISPLGSVLASTTNNDGRYSFTVAPTQKTYRVIPSKDGFIFSPVDKTFAGLFDDQKGIDFVGTISRNP